MGGGRSEVAIAGLLLRAGLSSGRRAVEERWAAVVVPVMLLSEVSTMKVAVRISGLRTGRMSGWTAVLASSSGET